LKNNYNHTDPAGNVNEDNHDLLNNIDFTKIINVAKKSIVWIILIILITNTLAYLYIRYTKPVYESQSELKLDVKSEASILGISNFNDANYNNISGEIELIRSKLFFNKIINVLDLDITYNTRYGKILNEERYRTSPFKVSYILKNDAFYDKPIDIEILNDKQFVLSYDKESFSQTCKFNEKIETPHFVFTIELTNSYDPETSNNKYYFTINSNRSLINYLSSNINVEPINFNANTIRISFTDHNKFKARDLVNAIDTLYLNYTQEEKNKANKQKIGFLDEQLAQTELKLEKLENYFENFTIDNKTINLQSEIGQAIRIMEQIDTQRYELRTKLVKVTKLYNQIKDQKAVELTFSDIAFLPKEITSDTEKLNTLLQEKDLLLSSYNESTFAAQKKIQQIEYHSSRLLGVLEDYKYHLIEAINKLSEKKADLERSFVSLPAKGTEYTKTKRFYSLYEDFYLSLIQRKAEYEIARAGTVTNFVILSSATLPDAPIYPKKIIVHGIGLASGLILSFLLIGVRYLLHNKITSQTELEQLTTAPVLGIIPFYKKEKMPTTKMVINHNPKSAVNEALRSVRTNMEFLNANSKKRVISVTSTISGEGKTFVTVNMGGIISLSESRVIVLDLDLRKPKIHLAFNDENSPKGISTVLINKHDWKDCVRKTSLPNLDYIPAGPTPPNPSELIISKAFDQMLSELKDSYDIVIMDTPPVGLVTDGILAMRKADLPIYVIRADYSKREFTKTLNRLIKVNKFKNIAVVLNSVDTSHMKTYGYYEENCEENGLINKAKTLFVKT
jgi:tyrosine-protein kinase Etk/Wzc